MSAPLCSSVLWRAEREALLTELQDLVHDLSQPLTALSLALTVAIAPIRSHERDEVLTTAQQQCTLAMRQVDALRNCLATKLTPPSGPTEESQDV